MKRLDQIPEEKENIEYLNKKINNKTCTNQQKIQGTNKISNKNVASYNQKNVLGNSSMQRVLSPTNKLANNALKSQTFNFKQKSIRPMPQVAVPEPEIIEELEDQIETLIHHQKSCQNESKYVEAEMAKQRVKELKVLLEKRTKEDFKQKHTKEMSEVQKVYLEEMDQFNQFWDTKLVEFEAESSRCEEELKQKHEIIYLLLLALL